jgi:hypothetical protein
MLYKGMRVLRPRFEDPKVTRLLALVGGFLDAAGGGWGPIVTSKLLVQGADPRKTEGTVNTAEFLLAISVSLVFLAHLGLEAFTAATIGLIIGVYLRRLLDHSRPRRLRPKGASAGCTRTYHHRAANAFAPCRDQPLIYPMLIIIIFWIGKWSDQIYRLS